MNNLVFQAVNHTNIYVFHTIKYEFLIFLIYVLNCIKIKPKLLNLFISQHNWSDFSEFVFKFKFCYKVLLPYHIPAAYHCFIY